MKKDDKISGYVLSKQWFDFVFNTKKMVRPIHTALYFWIVELNNRLGWKEVFGLPTQNAMQAISVNGYQHYKKALDDLIRWGFITLHEKAYNQYTCNQIAINLLYTLSTEQGIKQGIKQVSHSKTKETMQTEETIKPPESDKPPLDKPDFIDLVVKEFIKVFPDYVIVTPGKEKQMAGKLLAVFKKNNPDLNSDKMLQSLRGYFEQCKAIPDDWHKNRMSLAHIVSQYNAINNILKSGSKKKRDLSSEIDLDKQDHNLKPSEV